MNGERALASVPSEIGSKRQRRPSVRLGDIGGDPPYDSHFRRSTKQWKPPNFSLKDSGNPHKSSKTRNLLHLNSPGAETLDGIDNLDSFAMGSWKTKDSKKRATAKKVRTNWVSKVTDEGGGGEPDADDMYSTGEYLDDDGYREFDMENSESPLKDQSPLHSSENLAADNERDSSLYRRPSTRAGSRSRDHHSHDGIDISGPSDTDVRDRNGQCREDGVKIWLNGLGLGRYAPVFEIHEVDDEVLPLLTLEDLKDMGINAVGSRRKMYCAIQKLGKGFS
ncbi:hypothetical protein CDL15_Pgr014920 [Punica granatum]|nr:hypothetical protein CDL15_Pgr014920 [Punica granatum]